MWKRIDELLSQSSKHALLGPASFRVWMYTLIHSDISGVFPADARLIRSQCMPLLSVRLEQVEGALTEIESAGLIHLFDVGSKRYLVFHDHNQWNPASNLKNQKGTYPSPPTSLCQCIDVRDGDVPVASAPVLSSSNGVRGVQGGEGESLPPRRSLPPVINAKDEAMRQLFALAKQQNILAKDNTLTNYLAGWMRRLGGAKALHEKLMDPFVAGKTVIEIHDWMFPKVAQKALAPAVRSFKCAVCNDTGKVVCGYENREPIFGDCSCRRRKQGA